MGNAQLGGEVVTEDELYQDAAAGAGFSKVKLLARREGSAGEQHVLHHNIAVEATALHQHRERNAGPTAAMISNPNPNLATADAAISSVPFPENPPSGGGLMSAEPVSETHITGQLVAKKQLTAGAASALGVEQQGSTSGQPPASTEIRAGSKTASAKNMEAATTTTTTPLLSGPSSVAPKKVPLKQGSKEGIMTARQTPRYPEFLRSEEEKKIDDVDREHRQGRLICWRIFTLLLLVVGVSYGVWHCCFKPALKEDTERKWDTRATSAKMNTTKTASAAASSFLLSTQAASVKGVDARMKLLLLEELGRKARRSVGGEKPSKIFVDTQNGVLGEDAATAATTNLELDDLASLAI
ncbi:unnamed protein product [Amoebophrya sp. A120]|nr:unnamed protein product [Amoebophrya sp. A120]|eukprot:GSA120T00011363001.1